MNERRRIKISGEIDENFHRGIVEEEPQDSISSEAGIEGGIEEGGCQCGHWCGPLNTNVRQGVRIINIAMVRVSLLLLPSHRPSRLPLPLPRS